MTTIIVSLSGGKDSTAMLLYLVAHYGPERLIVHHQVLPEDWPETVPYVRELCARLGVPLGRLPGDVHIERQNFSCVIALGTSIFLSIFLTIVLNLIVRLLNK